MTVVIKLGPLGEIVQVYAAIPINVVQLKVTGRPKQLPLTPLKELQEIDEAVVANLLDPWLHLTTEQRERIENEAFTKLKIQCSCDAGYNNSVLRSHVHAMGIEDQLETIGDSDSEVGAALGFVPETGEPYVPDTDEELEQPRPTITWGRTNVGDRKWHALLEGSVVAVPKTEANKHVMTRYTATTLCGITGINVVGPVPLAVGETPHYSSTSSVCEKCKQFVPQPKE
jgi:hypothetical protein